MDNAGQCQGAKLKSNEMVRCTDVGRLIWSPVWTLWLCCACMGSYAERELKVEGGVTEEYRVYAGQ